MISELKRPRPEPNVQARLAAVTDEDLFLSVITIGELVNGIMRLAPGQRRRDLEDWLDRIEQLHSSRILPVDHETGRIWGEITARAAAAGHPIAAADGVIAATALRHGLHVMTRNTFDFQATGVLLDDPWAEADH